VVIGGGIQSAWRGSYESISLNRKHYSCGYWKYRLGALRVIVEIRAARLVVLEIRIGHRREVYR
jgi:mRNA-degrading endonuclease RelE of RelBE toxin-antitoxin system